MEPSLWKASIKREHPHLPVSLGREEPNFDRCMLQDTKLPYVIEIEYVFQLGLLQLTGNVKINYVGQIELSSLTWGLAIIYLENWLIFFFYISECVVRTPFKEEYPLAIGHYLRSISQLSGPPQDITDGEQQSQSLREAAEPKVQLLPLESAESNWWVRLARFME